MTEAKSSNNHIEIEATAQTTFAEFEAQLRHKFSAEVEQANASHARMQS